MGMFDTVSVPCPKCGKESDFQSKSGDCTLAHFQLENAPLSVLADVNRHAPNTCVSCKTRYYVETKTSREKTADGVRIITETKPAVYPT